MVRYDPDAPIVVAIDGPSGVGKSTVAQRVARQLKVPYLDTGAMYRAMGLKMLRAGLDPADRPAADEMAQDTDIHLEPEDGELRVLLDGEDVEELLRTSEVSDAASSVAAHTEVRQRMVELQRAAAKGTGGVLEGRDIGTRVFPDTPHKFFLDAQLETRVRRRYAQLKEKGQKVTLKKLRIDIPERDYRDSTRHDSPLTFNATYQLIDTTELDVEQVVEKIVSLVDEWYHR